MPVINAESPLLFVEKNVLMMHTIVALTVKKKEEVDYYCFEYNGQHQTHTIVWGMHFLTYRMLLA